MGIITIDPTKIIQGESDFDWIPNKGFSPDSYGLNLTKKKGLVYFTEASTDRGGATLTGCIIAATYDKGFLGNDGYFLDTGGAFYTLNGATFTKRQTVTADTFTIGTSEILQFQGNLYATSTQRIIKLDGSNISSVDSSWWTGLQNSYRHPMERVENSLYIGDLNQIHTWDGTTSTAAAITLPTDVNITSLRKHPDGRTLLAFCGLTANYSHTKGLGGRIYYIDTNTKSWTREIDIDVQIEGSRVVGGIIFVSFGKNIGYFDGNGIKFLKELKTNNTVYSHNMIAYENYLVVRDGREAVAFGNLGIGNVWWRIFKTQTNITDIDCMLYKGDNIMLFAFSGGATGILEEVDYDNSGIKGIFISNRYLFPQKVRIKKFEIIHDKADSIGTTQFIIYYKDTENTLSTILGVNYVNQTTTKTEFFTDIDTDIFQFQISPQIDDIGFKLIRIHYEPIN